MIYAGENGTFGFWPKRSSVLYPIFPEKMNDEQSRSTDTEHAEGAEQEASGTDPIERRERRREKRGQNTLILRELALIAALCLVILAFNLNWGNAEGDRDVAARQQDDIRLRDVRVTPPEPEPPEPEPEPQPPEPQPEPEVPDEMPREEVPDEQVEDEPEMTDEPVVEPMQELEVSPAQQTSEPAPPPNPKPQPKPEPPPTNKVFSKNTVDRNPGMQGSLSPEYPRSAQQAGIEGTVIVQFVVDESGRAQDIQVLRSPNDALSQAAVEAVREVSFSPGMQNGEPVKVRMAQPVVFRLN